MLTDGARDTEDVLEIGTAIFIRRRAHRDEDDLAMGDRRGGIGGEIELASRVVTLDDRLEAGFIDGDDALLEALYLGFVDVNADDVVAHFRETGAGDQTYITGTKDCDLHSCRL